MSIANEIVVEPRWIKTGRVNVANIDFKHKPIKGERILIKDYDGKTLSYGTVSETKSEYAEVIVSK